MNHEVVIGLEIHIELNTKSKMFCSCSNDSESEPNENICPACTAHPGTLSVVNKEAFVKAIKAGLALKCSIENYSRFDRKHYFYPDLPRGYQLTQQEYPICLGGHLVINGKKIRINRIHLEEDAGKLVHPEGEDYSLVDFNRSGVPLIELVTEPDIGSPQEAADFVQELREILRVLDVSNLNMEKGEMRVDANISLSLTPGAKDGGRVEIKNLNSFRSIKKALEYEIERQTEILNKKGSVARETRGWDEVKEETFFQRSKEKADDYRYFPDPDIPPIVLDDSFIDISQIRLPELPREKRERFHKEYRLSEKEIDFLVKNRFFGDYYEKVISELYNWVKEARLECSIEKDEEEKLTRLAANYLLTDMKALLQEKEETLITPENFAELIWLVSCKEISSSIAKILLKEMFETGGDPSNIIKEKRLVEMKDESEIEDLIEKVLADNEKAVEDYREGKEASIKFLIGQVMAVTKGLADPAVAEKIIKDKISLT